MQPWLLYTDALRVPAWVPMMAIAAIVAIAAVRRGSRHSILRGRTAVDAGWVVLPAAIVGGRLGDGLLGNPQTLTDLATLFDPLGGYSLYGAGLGGAIGAAVFSRRAGVDWRSLCDLWALGGLIALPFARLGCLAVGCCFGRPIEEPLGVALPWGVTLGAQNHPMYGVSIHPVALYEALFAMGLFLWIHRHRQQLAQPGQVAMATIAGYGMCRLLVDPLRADLARGVVFGPASASQIVALVTVTIALCTLIRSRKK